MTERDNTDCCVIRGYTKGFINSPYGTIFSNMKVLMAVVVVVVLTVFLVISSVIFIDLLPWVKEASCRHGDSFLSRNIASTGQSRMTSFLMRSLAVDEEPMVTEFVIASRSSATQSHGLIQLINLLTYCRWLCIQYRQPALVPAVGCSMTSYAYLSMVFLSTVILLNHISFRDIG